MSGFVERIVEDWLTRADERGFQLTFSSCLARRGHSVKYVSPHSSLEHGKDIISIAPGGELHAYQLKAGNISSSQWREMAEEVREAATLPVDVPGVRTRLADRAFLVLSGRLSDPVRDKIRLVNHYHKQRGFPEIAVIELAELVTWVVDAFEGFLPRSISSSGELMRIYLSDGRGRQECGVLHSTFQSFFKDARSGKKAARAIANIVIAAEFASAPFRRERNHISVIDTWVMAATSILLHAKERRLAPALWHRHFDLCWEAIAGAGESLLEEADSRENLLEGDNYIVDSQFLPFRRALVTGYIGATINSKAILGEDVRAASAQMLELVGRESPVAFWGESRWNYLLNVVLSLRYTVAGSKVGEALVLHWLELVCPRKAPYPKDPYWTIDDEISAVLAASSFDSQETTRISYTAAAAGGFLARRMGRPSLAGLWPKVSRFDQGRFVPERTSDYLVWSNDHGTTEIRRLPMQATWSGLRAEAAGQRSNLFEESELRLLPFFLCTYPHRVDPSLAGELDYQTSPAAFQSEWR